MYLATCPKIAADGAEFADIDLGMTLPQYKLHLLDRWHEHAAIRILCTLDRLSKVAAF